MVKKVNHKQENSCDFKVNAGSNKGLKERKETLKDLKEKN